MLTRIGMLAVALIFCGCQSSDQRPDDQGESAPREVSSASADRVAPETGIAVTEPVRAVVESPAPTAAPVEPTPVPPFAFSALSAKVIEKESNQPVEIMGTSLDRAKVFYRTSQGESELAVQENTGDKIIISGDAVSQIPAGEVELVLRKEGVSDIVVPNKLEVN